MITARNRSRVGVGDDLRGGDGDDAEHGELRQQFRCLTHAFTRPSPGEFIHQQARRRRRGDDKHHLTQEGDRIERN